LVCIKDAVSSKGVCEAVETDIIRRVDDRERLKDNFG